MDGMRILTIVVMTLASPIAWAADPPFMEFPAGQVARGPSVPPDLSAPDAKAYRTRLRDAVRGTANFAGHYSLATWGCGTSCAMGAVVDRLNGHVAFLPSVCCTEHWSDNFEPIVWRPNSRLIVMSGKINEEGPDVVHYFTLDGDAVREVRSVPFPSDTAPTTILRAGEGKMATDCKAISSAVARLDCYDQANGR